MISRRLDTSIELLTARLVALSEPAVLATIVSTEGSTYRKAGARMLIEANGRMTGLLSGGCLERDLAEHLNGFFGLFVVLHHHETEASALTGLPVDGDFRGYHFPEFFEYFQ